MSKPSERLRHADALVLQATTLLYRSLPAFRYARKRRHCVLEALRLLNEIPSWRYQPAPLVPTSILELINTLRQKNR
jgi:hypothetical protein